MATKYEEYSAGGDNDWRVESNRWVAQTFTPSISHKITSIKLYAKRTGAPGTLTIQIQGVDGGGHPDGAVKCSGTDNASGWEAFYQWHEISLGAGAALDAETEYCIMAEAKDGDADNAVHWYFDTEGSGGGYAAGHLEYSTDSGESWLPLTDADFYFEEWGDPLGGEGMPGLSIGAMAEMVGMV